jgi:hypothetical protein
MRKWKREGYEVIERPFDYDLHQFDVVLDSGEIVGTITPATLVDMEAIAAVLDLGDDVNGWEDGMGNTIYVR